MESEIASEQARSAALRDAFEGRRSRFATAETAAHNAETGDPTGDPTGGAGGDMGPGLPSDVTP